jgi:hypothetical protein
MDIDDADSIDCFTFFSPSVLKYARLSSVKQRLAFYCKGQEVGKHVYERVENVNGVFSYIPAGDFLDNFMHINDSTGAGRDNFTKQPEKRYGSFDTTSFDPKAEPFATAIRYGFTWTPLTSIQDINSKLYGDEMTIFDNENGKVLAVRVVYYVLSEKDNHLEAACNVRYGGFYNGDMVDNYPFVSSVLKPVEPSIEQKQKLYDVIQGGGAKEYPSICMKPIRIAEGVGKDDITIQRLDNNLVVSLKSSPQDSYSCGFFGGLRSASFPDEDKIPRILFADGQFIASPELLAKFGAD